MTTLASTAGQPRWKVIFDWLLDELDKFEYGNDFYTASDLCSRFEVSSITAVRALNELAGRGLIEKIQGRGTVVRRMTRKATLWIVTPDSHQSRSFASDSVRSRLIQGVHQLAAPQSIEVGMISESNLRTFFPRQDEHAGFLILRPHGSRTVRFLRKHKLPYLLLDPSPVSPAHPYVGMDRVSAGYQATKHLLELGHRRIGWITGPVNLPNFHDRLRGYRKALQEAGLPFKWELVKQTMPTPEGAMIASHTEAEFNELLALRRPPTALLMGDDTRAIQVLQFCKQRGIDVPGRLSVVGFPNLNESRLTTPPLTVIDGCFEKVSSAACSLLLDIVFGKTAAKPKGMLITPQLCIRSSTGPAKTTRKKSTKSPALSAGRSHP